MVKFDSNLMGRSKVYSANKFRDHPPLGGGPEGQSKIIAYFYAYDNMHIKFMHMTICQAIATGLALNLFERNLAIEENWNPQEI